MMLQELFDRWAEIQNERKRNETARSEQDKIAEELNILEAMRLLDCKAIPGEKSDVQALINDRHKRLEEILQKRKG